MGSITRQRKKARDRLVCMFVSLWTDWLLTSVYWLSDQCGHTHNNEATDPNYNHAHLCSSSSNHYPHFITRFLLQIITGRVGRQPTNDFADPLLWMFDALKLIKYSAMKDKTLIMILLSICARCFVVELATIPHAVRY